MKNKIPKLRFPEFSGEWEEKKLGDISSNVMYGMNAAATEFDGQNKYIRITDISEANNKFIPNRLSSPLGNLEDRFLVNENDILFARTGASTGKSYLYDSKDGILYYAGFLIRFNINKENNSKYIFYQTLTKKYQNWLKIMSMRSGQPGINAEEYKGFEMDVPSLPEQEKIANFLSSVDTKIEKLEKKKKLLEKYKKGMIQKLFSQKLRFKDENGNDYSEWKEKKLGEIGKVSMCKRIMKDQTTISGEIPFYKIGTFGKQADAFITYELFNEYKSKYSYPAIGDILLSASGTIGRTVIYDGKPAYFQDSNIVWISNNEKLLKNNFLYYLYSNMNWTTEDTTIARLYNNNLISMKINIPSLPEQEKIANLLSSIDRKIELAEEELEKNKEFKKGLLQQMFV